MSHTDKTDPAWVRRNDPTLERYIDHDHTHFGRPIYKRRYVLDEHGERVKVENRPGIRRVQMINDEALAAYEALGVSRHSVMTQPWFYPGVISHVEVEIPRGFHFERETYIAGYEADHCTGDQPLTREDTWRRPCSPMLSGVSWWKLYGRYGASKDERQEWHGSDRRKVRDQLRAYTKRANWAEDEEDWDDSEIAHSERRHTIIWW